MNTIWIVPIEPIDARYTAQWYINIPEDLRVLIRADKLPLRVETIDGVQSTGDTTSGAFLNFAFTNAYKASQVMRISELFGSGQVVPGDRFLITDAWNFSITAIKYMSELLNIPVTIHGIWHAGAYDPSDILGMKMSQNWVRDQEKAWANACDYNYFATEFHRSMFCNKLFDCSPSYPRHNKMIRSGQPHSAIIPGLLDLENTPKLDRVMWPHRYNSDKQPEIAEDLAKDFDVLITQNHKFSKDEYYTEMAKSKVIFSCALHENLGISVMEGALTGAIPILPHRCSYVEMYSPEFLYPAIWTSSYDNFLHYRYNLVQMIHDRITNYEKYLPALEKQKELLMKKYLNANIMYKHLLTI